MAKIKITESIKTFEDAQKATGRPNVPDFSNLPEDLRAYFEAQYKMIVIAEVLNEGWQADWSNSNQRKWFPWHFFSSGSFRFHVTTYQYSYAYAGIGSRLCFATEELAEYAGEQFLEIWQAIIQK